MFTKEKVGDIERIYPNAEFKDILEKVLSQNSRILEMNNKVIDSLCNPPLIFKEVNESKD